MIDFTKASTMSSADPDPEPFGKSENPFAVPTVADIIKPVFDLAQFDKQAEKFRDRIKPITAEIDSVAVTDEETAALVVERVAVLAKVKKEIGKARDKTIRKPNDFVKTVRQLAKQLIDICDEGINGGKTKIGRFEYKREQDRRAAEAKAAKAAREAQKALERQAKADGTKAVKIPDIPIPETRSPMRTETGTASTRFVEVMRIEDITKVPFEYLLPNEQKIKAARKAGLTIPGVVWEEKPVVSVRT